MNHKVLQVVASDKPLLIRVHLFSKVALGVCEILSVVFLFEKGLMDRTVHTSHPVDCVRQTQTFSFEETFVESSVFVDVSC